EDADRECEKSGWQRSERDAHAGEPPRHQNGDHRANGHQVAMREVGKSQDAVDQRDAERAERKLRAVGEAWDENEVGKDHEGIEEVFHDPQPPRNDARTSGLASKASPVSVKRLAPCTST